MANMSYCRFQNTLSDLKDCFQNLNDTDLSQDERDTRLELVEVAKQIVDECFDEDGELIPFEESEDEEDDIPAAFGTHQVRDIG